MGVGDLREQWKEKARSRGLVFTLAGPCSLMFALPLTRWGLRHCSSHSLMIPFPHPKIKWTGILGKSSGSEAPFHPSVPML